jgi:hypothetical protein
MPDATPDELRPIIRQWHAQALPFVRTKPFDESWTDFAVAWSRVKRPAGASFAAAAASAGVPAVAQRLGYDGALARLAGLCDALQRQWGGRPFPLGCRKAAEYLGVSKTEANRLLAALQFDHVLELVTKGTKATGKASEWRVFHREGGA